MRSFLPDQELESLPTMAGNKTTYKKRDNTKRLIVPSLLFVGTLGKTQLVEAWGGMR